MKKWRFEEGTVDMKKDPGSGKWGVSGKINGKKLSNYNALIIFWSIVVAIVFFGIVPWCWGMIEMLKWIF